MCELCTLTQNFDPARHTVGGTLEWPEPEPVPTPEPLPAGTLDDFAAYLTTGFWSDFGTTSRSFPQMQGNSTNYVITVNLTGLTVEGQRLARWALDTWELVADLQFSEVESDGDIIVDDEDGGAYAQSEFVSIGSSEIETSYVNIDKGWVAAYGATLDSFAFSTYVHEFGHALGLGHLGNYNFDSGGATFSNDSYQHSVMSYIPQDQNDEVNASYAQSAGPMIADILAIQNLYGVSSATQGDTVWGQGGTMSRHFATLYAGVDDSDPATEERGPIAFSLYDGPDAGIDTIDLRPSKTNDRLNLNDETFSNVAGLVGNLSIARGSEFEVARMGSGNDTVYGNELDNQIFGFNGRDKLFGGAGMDKLFGGKGRDRLFGGSKDDWLNGNQGRDRLRGGEGNDTLTGGLGADEFFFGFGHDSDRIRDFTLGVDELLFSSIDFNGVSAQLLIDTYGQVGIDGIVLDFGDSEVLGADSNDQLLLEGVFDLDALVDDVSFI